MSNTTTLAPCIGVEAYGTREQAERMAAPLRRAGQSVRAYPCLKCRNWHVGERQG